MSKSDGTTHWETCWKDVGGKHGACALQKIVCLEADLTAANDRYAALADALWEAFGSQDRRDYAEQAKEIVRELSTANATIERLSAPVTDEEYEKFTACGYTGDAEVLNLDGLNALIAERIKDTGLSSNKETCANCGKSYSEHLMHDGNKCGLDSANSWFPKSIADTIAARAERKA